MNNFNFTGHLGADCERKATASGATVVSFNVAVSTGYGDKKGTLWVRCNLWGKAADGQLPSYLVKGQQVAVSGEINLRQWLNQQGEAKAAINCHVSDLTLIGGKQQGQQSNQPAAQSQPAQPQQYRAQPSPNANLPHGNAPMQQGAPDFGNGNIDDIPF